ncbi:nucleotidyltransferase substrate binding protein [Shouchella clausii]|uniref:nucleotidyltransferase substrate binding protein n=1 Tax=Shouchella clausii TaxID=79880 RepID=UPI0031FC25B9
MNHPKPIRWKQRFQNFKRAYLRLKEAVDRYEQLSDLEKEGMIQRFEYTFELSWKTLKDYLESEGVEVRFPREVIKTAYQYELIDHGEVWMNMLESRNILSHTYNEKSFQEAVGKVVHSYFQEISSLYQEMERLYHEK